DVIMPKLPDRSMAGLFRRYEALFEAFANMDRFQRLLNYKMINGLMLTSYAKKQTDRELKKKMFELKNDIFINLASDRDFRRMLAFKYLKTKNFRVLQFCRACEET